ncbi:nucleotide sugar dehydrogenase [Nocardia uniformis]|uniref:Nucleotide sugar dehydrogenase n=2 Tax=Nocardia uniformis TaxID=53432 RepID=A0A849CHU8_9NOCA|nr:nucleotide sugar dehydrogenase [Nocardia uniformis]
MEAEGFGVGVESGRDPTRLVVVGLGYVGLPLATAAAVAGFDVHGFDRNPERVRNLTAGESHVEGLPASELRQALLKGLQLTTATDCLASADVIVICVPTPLLDGEPDLSAIIDAGTLIGQRMKRGALVVLESTSYPGTTTEVLQPLLSVSGKQAGKDYRLAFSPERIDPGNARFGLQNTPKVVGGVTEACLLAATDFYSQVVTTLVPVSSPEVAEMTKLLENTYRHVNIALINEIAIISRDLGIDLWEVIDAASTKPFGFQRFEPGPGVGGHCIPVDPNYLAYRVRQLGYPFRLVELAQEINSGMPRFVVDQVVRILDEREVRVRGATVLLLGVAYKANVADQRGTPAREIADVLTEMGVLISYHDPYVEEFEVSGQVLKSVLDLDNEVSEADLVVLLQVHAGYDPAHIANLATFVLDTRGAVTGTNVSRL